MWENYFNVNASVMPMQNVVLAAKFDPRVSPCLIEQKN